MKKEIIISEEKLREVISDIVDDWSYNNNTPFNEVVSYQLFKKGIIMKEFNYNLIDLGLPSGTLWMDRNIGASSPEDAGLYFAWGETQGYTADEVVKTREFIWKDYKFRKSDETTTLEVTDDAVSQNINECHIPTKEQIIELLKETDVYCVKEDGTEVHGVWHDDNQNIIWESKIDENEQLSGIEFRKKTDNTTKVFVPCAGFAREDSIISDELFCFLWSNVGGTNGAWCFDSYCDKACCAYATRSYGFPLRGVKNKEN